MNAALTLKPMAQLAAQYGPMRMVLGSEGPTDTPAELADVYRFNILGGNDLRESVIKRDTGMPVLGIRLVEYIDPVTQRIRYGVDYWTVSRQWVRDHAVLAIAEKAYEDAVRDEYTRPTLHLSPERFTRGLTGFYDVTDVL
ncbi:hypothetical protein [Streptomyces sp. NPDC046685]|uniref:hypothetical protein n=1 Tax=Streptomyces sp. NPDC046685 TaxID=3157202 RepID=UPI0033FC46BC